MASSEQSPTTQSGPDAVGILTACCAEGTPALAIPIDVGVPLEALFVAVTDREVTLAIAAETAGAYALCPCLVSFSHEGRVMAFLSQIQDWSRKITPQRLVLELPSKLLAMEKRRLFRIPLRGKHGLDVVLTTEDGTAHTVNPIDIAVGGILLEFNADPGLKISTPHKIRMTLGEDTVEVSGLVRHRCGRRYGLSFHEIMREGRIRPPKALAKIVKTLEEHWLGSKTLP
jgi:hypothetical protein